MAVVRLCSIPNCGKRHFGRGYCGAHYERWRRHGDPLMGRAAPLADMPITCTIPGCDNPHDRRGYCTSHYYRFIRHGDPLAGATYQGEPLRWIEDHAKHTGEACLIWPFAKGREDYGVVRFRNLQMSAPKVMCTIAHGEGPSPDHETAHSCGNGHLSCINPNHIRWDTRAGNHADKKIHGTHLQGEAIHNHILTEANVREIRQLRAAGMGIKELSARFAVSRSAISKINVGKMWAWVG